MRLTREQVALDPLAEEPNRRLIERLAAAGDRAAALAAGERFAERLRSALGDRAVARDARAARRRCGARRPRRCTAAGAPRAHDDRVRRPRAPSSSGCAPSWAGVQLHRDRRIVLIAGEPGVGKTRLAHRFAREVARRAARAVLLGRCSEEPLAPFEPFAEALRQVGAADASCSPAQDRRRRRAPPALRRRRRRAHRARRRAGLLLVIDDLHWADRGTLLLTSFLLRSARPAPLLVLGTYRDTELGRRSPLTGALADLQRDGALDRIGLRGLRRGRRRRARARAARRRRRRRARARPHRRQRVLRRGGAARARRASAGGAGERAPRRRRPALAAQPTPPTSCSPPPRCSASSSTRARWQARPGWSPPPPRPRSTRCCARGCCGRAAAAGASSSRTRSCARRSTTSSTCCAARGCTAARPRRCAALGEDRHLEEIATHLFAGGVARRRARGRRPARPRRAPGARAARLRGRRRALRARARGARARRRRGRGRPGAARPRRRAAARRRARGARARLRRRRAARPPPRRRRRCWPRPRSASPASASRSSTSTPRRSPGSRRRSRRAARLAGAALAAAGPPRGRALLRARPHALGGAQRRGRRHRARRPATRARSPSALNARHVALWRPDRIEERLATAADDDRGGARGAASRTWSCRRATGA